MKISITIEQARQAAKERPRLINRVRGWIEEVESGTPNRTAWMNLRRIFKHLAAQKKLSPCHLAIFKLIRPIMEKYGDKSVISAVYPFEENSTDA